MRSGHPWHGSTDSYSGVHKLEEEEEAPTQRRKEEGKGGEGGLDECENWKGCDGGRKSSSSSSS